MTGRPSPAQTVTLLDQLGFQIAATHTEATGWFLFEEVAPGTHTLFASVASQRSDAQVLTVQAALPIDVVLNLAAHIAESVVVQDTTDAPSATARMTIAGGSRSGAGG